MTVKHDEENSVFIPNKFYINFVQRLWDPPVMIIGRKTKNAITSDFNYYSLLIFQVENQDIKFQMYQKHHYYHRYQQAFAVCPLCVGEIRMDFRAPRVIRRKNLIALSTL